jgi:hypothetical protein
MHISVRVKDYNENLKALVAEDPKNDIRRRALSGKKDEGRGSQELLSNKSAV